jgi:hypothetical protein
VFFAVADKVSCESRQLDKPEATNIASAVQVITCRYTFVRSSRSATADPSAAPTTNACLGWFVSGVLTTRFGTRAKVRRSPVSGG